MKHFFDDQHANNRLQRCYAICKNRKGETKVRRIDQATRRHVVLDNGSVVVMDDPTLILVPEHLGYVNTKHQCAYISRNTRRMWKVGICPENLQVDFVFPKGNRFEQFSFEEAIKSIVDNNYPNFRKSLLEIKAGRRAVTAFCPTMAVGLSNQTALPVIYYKNRQVAYIKDNKIVMGDVNSHLVNVLSQYTNMEIIF